MLDHDQTNDIPMISSYSVEDAVEDGALLALMPPAEAPKQPAILPINQIGSMDEYLKNYGAILGRKAIHALNPLHVPNRDQLLDFDDCLREPFPCQGHVITAAVKMLEKVGSGFIVGEMGTGKTLLGMLSAHKHAQRSRRQGGSNGKYRAIVLCPDHLIGKWCRELEETIPDAIITRFGPQGDGTEKKAKKKRKKGDPKEDSNTRATLRDVCRLLNKGGDGRNPFYPGKGWSKPEGAEWFVLGRNQAKWMSDWSGMANPSQGFSAVRGKLTEIATTAMIGRDRDGNPLTETTYHEPLFTGGAPKANAVSSKSVVVDKIKKVDANGYPIYDKRGYPVTSNVTARLHYCPRCGTVARDKKGVPLGVKDLISGTKASTQKTCRGTYAVIVPDPEKPKVRSNDVMCPIDGRFGDKKPGQTFNHGGFKWIVKECKEPLWNWTSKPYRWSPASIIQRKLKRMFKYLLIDEVHEQKSDESAQSMACSKLIGSVDHVIALTGTIIGGYADHLFPLMMRITPKTLIDEGFTWGRSMPFSETYGRIDRIVTIKEEDDGPAIHGNVKSMRRAGSGNRYERKAVRPGVMPTMFGRHLIGSAMFITLEELADELPDLFEYVGGSMGAAPTLGDFRDDAEVTAEEKLSDALDNHQRMEDGWFDTACEMEPDQKAEYKRVTAILEFANKQLLRKGSMKLLGSYLWTGLDYPDRPFGWGHDPDVIKDLKTAHKKTGDVDEALAKLKLGHTIGFWDQPGIRTVENFVGVVTPQDCPEDRVYPKEQQLIDICKKQKADGRQTWVYVNMTNKRNIQPRLAKLLEKEGLKVGILRSGDVEPIEREEWIAQHGREFDVMISHPQLVSTGLDLFSKSQGGHNYSTLVFYETGYNLFTMRQAARRAWRIGQPHDCRVYYMYYRETMQHKAMALMSKKLAAAQALEGEFSADGLAAMAGEDNLQMALAKNLSERIDDSDMQRGWGKIKSGPKKVKRPGGAVAEMTPAGAKASPLDDLPIELQIVAESLIESQSKPIPPAAAAEFGDLHARLSALDDAFEKMEGFDTEAEPETKDYMEEARKLIEEVEDYGSALACGMIEPEAVTTTEEVEGGTLTVEVQNGEALSIKYTVTDNGDGTKTTGDLAIEKVAPVAKEKKKRAKRAPKAKDETILQMPEYDNMFDESLDADGLPVLTEEILAKFFANMMANGIAV